MRTIGHPYTRMLHSAKERCRSLLLTVREENFMEHTLWKHLKEFMLGMGDVVVIAPRRNYVRPRTNGFAADQYRLRRDVRRVGQDIRVALERHG